MLEVLIDNIFVMFGGRGYTLLFVGQKHNRAVLYCYFNMPTIYKTFLIFIRVVSLESFITI